MIDLFSEEMRRDPYRAYRMMRTGAPVFHLAAFDLWMIFDFDGVKQALLDHHVFSSDLSQAQGQGNPGDWFIFFDPPRHTKLRGIISSAFTPRVIADLELRIRELSRQLLDDAFKESEFDLAAQFSVPLPMRIMAGMLGVPAENWPRYKRWSDVILKIANTFKKDEAAARTIAEYRSVTAEMRAWLSECIGRRSADQDDLLTRLVNTEVNGDRLTLDEILGFAQLLLVAGQETTANLINNAVLCLMEDSTELGRPRAAPELLPSAIEEVLRYRSPVQWVPRATKRDVELNGKQIPAEKLVLLMIGSANRDPRQFNDAERFDVARTPNPHLAFGYGIHSCLGAPLARMEARIALKDFLERTDSFGLATTEPLEPRAALHVHGPSRLPIRVTGKRGRDC